MLIISNAIVQVRIGNVIELDGKLVHVVKSFHGAGQGRQLGNVQVKHVLGLLSPIVD